MTVSERGEITMTAWETNSVITKAERFDGFKRAPVPCRTVLDYELELITQSGGGMVLDGLRYDFQEGDVVWRRPGQYVSSLTGYECHVIFFILQESPCGSDNGASLFQLLKSIPPVYHTTKFETMRRMFEQIMKYSVRIDELSQLRTSVLLFDLLCTILEECKEKQSEWVHPKVKQALRYLDSHYAAEVHVAELIEKAV